jgi:hypothetical protein
MDLRTSVQRHHRSRVAALRISLTIPDRIATGTSSAQRSWYSLGGAGTLGSWPRARDRAKSFGRHEGCGLSWGASVAYMRRRGAPVTRLWLHHVEAERVQSSGLSVASLLLFRAECLATRLL